MYGYKLEFTFHVHSIFSFYLFVNKKIALIAFAVPLPSVGEKFCIRFLIS